MWFLLYAQVHQADDADRRNLLLSRRQGFPIRQKWRFPRQGDGTLSGTATWSHREVDDMLQGFLLDTHTHAAQLHRGRNITWDRAKRGSARRRPWLRTVPAHLTSNAVTGAVLTSISWNLSQVCSFVCCGRVTSQLAARCGNWLTCADAFIFRQLGSRRVSDLGSENGARQRAIEQKTNAPPSFRCAGGNLYGSISSQMLASEAGPPASAARAYSPLPSFSFGGVQAMRPLMLI